MSSLLVSSKEKMKKKTCHDTVPVVLSCIHAVGYTEETRDECYDAESLTGSLRRRLDIRMAGVAGLCTSLSKLMGAVVDWPACVDKAR